MKKLIAVILALFGVLGLVGCSGNKDESTTYSFRGEHEYFAISNVSINLDDNEIVFDGGNIEITQAGFFDEVASYTTTFYTLTNGEQKIILSNAVIDKTGVETTIDSDLGNISGEGILDNGVKDIDDLKENLWFELKVVDLNGTETVYQIQLTLID